MKSGTKRKDKNEHSAKTESILLHFNMISMRGVIIKMIVRLDRHLFQVKPFIVNCQTYFRRIFVRKEMKQTKFNIHLM